MSELLRPIEKPNRFPIPVQFRLHTKNGLGHLYHPLVLQPEDIRLDGQPSCVRVANAAGVFALLPGTLTFLTGYFTENQNYHPATFVGLDFAGQDIGIPTFSRLPLFGFEKGRVLPNIIPPHSIRNHEYELRPFFRDRLQQLEFWYWAHSVVINRKSLGLK